MAKRPASGAAPRVALVTGASSGFGLLTCVELARAGLRVFASMRDLGRSGRLDQALAEAGLSADKVRLDVTDAGSIAAAVATVTQAAGQIDVLVNNAGFGMGGFVEDLSLPELREQFETNFFGLVALTKAVVPGMRERRYGRIINVSSINGRVAVPGLAAYSSSKFAVEGFSESLRHELLLFGVHVSLVEPGTFRTDIFDRNRRMAAGASDPASPYHAITTAMDKLVTRQVERSKADPRAVARTIATAATATRPRLRYLVGTDARVQSFARALLPFRAIEATIGAIVRPRRTSR